MLVNYNFNKGDITITSIPRDSYVQVTCKNDAYDKINHAYAYGGKECLNNSVSKLFGLNNIKNIDYLVATHPHEDHIGGLTEVCEKIEIKNVFMPDISSSTKTFNRFLKALNKNNVNAVVAKKGVVIKENDELKVEILSPVLDRYEELNDYSAVVKITYKDTSFLFMGDCEKVSESLIDENDLKADVIKIGHHGSGSSTASRFIKKVNPKYAVICVGKDNDYGHPHDEVLNRLYNLGISVLRTDEDGNIKIKTDGKNITVME